MAHKFVEVPLPLVTLKQDVLILFALALLTLLPTLLIAQAAYEASQKGHPSQQERVLKKLSLPQPTVGADVKTARRKKRKPRKPAKKNGGQQCGQDGPANGGQQDLSDSDDTGAALEAAWSGSEFVDAPLKNCFCVGSPGVAGGEPMAAPFLPASASQVELQQAETNELPGVAERQQSDEFHAGVQDCWQLEADPQCETTDAVENDAEWGCIAERKYGRMLFLLHREIRAETLRRCAPGPGPLPCLSAAMAQESMPLKGLSTRRLTLWPC